MKKKNTILWLLFIIVVLAVLGMTMFLNNNEKTETLQNVEKLQIVHGDKFTYLDEFKDKYIIDYQLQDITKDNIKDDLILVGDKELPNDVYAQNICLIIRNGNTGKYSSHELKDMKGYETHISLDDLTNDDINELIISSSIGGSVNNKVYCILQYENEKISEIFNVKNSAGIKVEGEFKDNYTADIKIEKVKNKMNVDLSDKKDYYTKKEIYDQNSKLINKDVKIKAYPINNLEKIKLEDNTIGIKTSQNIMGVDKTDIIDVIECTLKFNRNKFEIIAIESQKMSKLL